MLSGTCSHELQVFPNGEDVKQAVYVWGESLQQILENASMRLQLRKVARKLYTLDGSLVSRMDALERDQLLCVSLGEGFMCPRDAQANVEVRANWGRARRMYGPRATDITVQARCHAQVGVDPFGPPAFTKKPDAAPASFDNVSGG